MATTKTQATISIRDEHGQEITQVQTKRRFTHAVIVKAETPSRVFERHTRRLAEDKELHQLLLAELQMEPVVQTAGRFEDQMISIRIPEALRGIIDTTYAKRSAQADAVEAHRNSMVQALACLEARISESEETLLQLEEGSYNFAPARLVTCHISKSNGQAGVRQVVALERESSELLGLAITAVHPVAG